MAVAILGTSGVSVTAGFAGQNLNLNTNVGPMTVNVGTGAQTIRTSGMNAAGEGLAVRSSGGSAPVSASTSIGVFSSSSVPIASTGPILGSRTSAKGCCSSAITAAGCPGPSSGPGARGASSPSG